MTNREIMLMWLLGAAIFGAGMYAARLF